MYKKFTIIFRYLIFISIGVLIYNLYSDDTVRLSMLLGLTLTLAANDFMRLKLSKNSYYNLSLAFSIIGASMLRYLLMETETIPYLVSILIEIMELEGIRLKFFFSLHFSLFLALLTLDIGFPTNCHKVALFATTSLSYIAIAYTSYLMNIIKKEKEKSNKLNEDLRLSNLKLQQYALEIEELTSSRERTFMAQELHDSIGHSLMALIMHLEFAENIYDTSPMKVKEILLKSKDITKSSIQDLRKSVNLLKESREIQSFNDAVESIINNFSILNDIKFTFNINESIDTLSSNIKSSMYKTIKEFVTNSIKHGRSTEININILKDNDKLLISLSNNGLKCSKISKSTGLIGMENRVTSLNGNIDYSTNNNKGFCINICIPI